MDEIQFINDIKQKTYKQSSLIKGVGDDAAVFRERINDIVIAKDTFVENVHFSKETMSLFTVGYRCLAANLSDLAAMGATPMYYLVSIVIPEHISTKNLTLIYEGMNVLASKYQMDLIGGDTVSGDQLVLTVTIIGHASDEKVRYRHTAQVNDIVFVTGTLGDSKAGLHILMNDLNVCHRDYFVKRHRTPEPRVYLSQLFKKINNLTLNDVSDGIATEVLEIAQASKKSIVLDDDKIPVHEALKQFSSKQRNEWKYSGGEDYELVGTVAEDDWSLIVKCAKLAKVKITKIGLVTHLTDEFVYIRYGDRLEPLNMRGYTHLGR